MVKGKTHWLYDLNMYDFEYLNDQFLNMGAIHSVSELQGMLCGMLSGGSDVSREHWRDEAIRFMDLAHLELPEEKLALLDLLLAESEKHLRDDNFIFRPLLPGDSATINRRVDELGAWCQGYLHGLGSSGLSGDATLSPDVAGALRDLAQISNAVLDEDADMEENEVYWNELVEYVKVAVLNIHGEFKRSPDRPTGESIH